MTDASPNEPMKPRPARASVAMTLPVGEGGFGYRGVGEGGFGYRGVGEGGFGYQLLGDAPQVLERDAPRLVVVE